MAHLDNSGYEPVSGSTSVPISICRFEICGTTVRSQTAAENASDVVALCHNQHDGINTVTPAAVQHLTDASKLSRWAKHEDLYAELGWRLAGNGPVFTTVHRVILEGTDQVTFFGNMAWTEPLTAYVTGFHQYAAEQEAALSRSTSASYNHRNHVQPAMQRARDLSTAVAQARRTAQGLSSEAVGRATMSRRPGTQDRERLQVSQRLVQAHQEYARAEYLSTGNTSEVLRAMAQSQRVGAAIYQQQQQHALDEGGDGWGDL